MFGVSGAETRGGGNYMRKSGCETGFAAGRGKTREEGAAGRAPPPSAAPIGPAGERQQPVVKRRRRTEAGEAPRRPGATTANTGSI